MKTIIAAGVALVLTAMCGGATAQDHASPAAAAEYWLSEIPNAKALVAAQDESIPILDPTKDRQDWAELPTMAKNTFIEQAQTEYNLAKMYWANLPSYDRRVCLVYVNHNPRLPRQAMGASGYYLWLERCLMVMSRVEDENELKHFQP